MFKLSICLAMRLAAAGVKIVEHGGDESAKVGECCQCQREKAGHSSSQYRCRLAGRWSATKVMGSRGIILFLKIRYEWW